MSEIVETFEQKVARIRKVNARLVARPERGGDIETQLRQVLAETEILMHGTITNYSPRGGGHGADSRPPTGELRPPHLLWRARWEDAKSDHERENVLKAAQANLDSYRIRTVGVVIAEVSIETIIIEDGEGFSPEMVGQRYGLSAHHVRRLRARHDRRTNDGTECKPNDTDDGLPRITADRRRAEVERMNGRGMSNRQIALILSCDEITVRRDLAALRVAA